jgi:hypothetical protein
MTPNNYKKCKTAIILIRQDRYPDYDIKRNKNYTAFIWDIWCVIINDCTD